MKMMAGPSDPRMEPFPKLPPFLEAIAHPQVCACLIARLETKVGDTVLFFVVCTVKLADLRGTLQYVLKRQGIVGHMFE